jgi:hypothetical protein
VMFIEIDWRGGKSGRSFPKSRRGGKNVFLK